MMLVLALLLPCLLLSCWLVALTLPRFFQRSWYWVCFVLLSRMRLGFSHRSLWHRNFCLCVHGVFFVVVHSRLEGEKSGREDGEEGGGTFFLKKIFDLVPRSFSKSTPAGHFKLVVMGLGK